MMKIIKKVKKEVEEIDDVICNKCGKSLRIAHDDYKSMSFHGLYEVEANFGYGSKFDGDKLKFSICEKCTFEFIMSFNIDPNYCGMNSSELTLEDLYKSIEKIYGFKKEKSLINPNSNDFLSHDELNAFHKKLKKEVDKLTNDRVKSALKK